MTISVRTARLIVLIAWSGLLSYLWLWHDVERYLGARTAWVVPFGALTLIVTTTLYGMLSKESADARRRLGPGELTGTVAMIVPIVVVLVLSSASLGALAASRKLSARGISESRLNAIAATKVSRISFLEVETAADHPAFARTNGILPGRPIHLVGLVIVPQPRAGSPIRLGRFYITCCVADSIAIYTAVLPGRDTPQVRKDQWLSVSGTIVRRHRDFAIRATSIDPVPQPKHPYLDFNG